MTIWGFIAGDQALWLIPVDTADNVLHLAISLIGIGAGLASPGHPRRHSTLATPEPA